MVERTGGTGEELGTWRYAAIGGVLSIPVTLGVHWLSGAENAFSLAPVVVGGLVAGYLAARGTANPGTAGLGAGAIGGLPAYVWILPAILETATDFATAWSFPPVAIVLTAVFTGVVVATAAAVGVVGGFLGGLLGRVLTGLRVPTLGVS